MTTTTTTTVAVGAGTVEAVAISYGNAYRGTSPEAPGGEVVLLNLYTAADPIFVAMLPGEAIDLANRILRAANAAR